MYTLSVNKKDILRLYVVFFKIQYMYKSIVIPDHCTNRGFDNTVFKYKDFNTELVPL